MVRVENEDEEACWIWHGSSWSKYFEGEKKKNKKGEIHKNIRRRVVVVVVSVHVSLEAGEPVLAGLLLELTGG